MPPLERMATWLAARVDSATPETEEARRARTAAACSSAVADSRPLRKVWMIGGAQLAWAMETLLAWSDDWQRSQSAYSLASREPSVSSVTNLSMPPAIATVICESLPFSALMSLSAEPARWRTSSTSDPRSLISCAVTWTRYCGALRES